MAQRVSVTWGGGKKWGVASDEWREKKRAKRRQRRCAAQGSGVSPQRAEKELEGSKHRMIQEFKGAMV
jgi:hypothetical protein